MGGIFKRAYLWVLTRDPIEIGTAEHDTMTDTVFPIIRERFNGEFVPEKQFYATKQSTNSGCVYNLPEY